MSEEENYEEIKGTFECDERFAFTEGVLEYVGLEEVSHNGIKYIREDVVAKREAILVEALEFYAFKDNHYALRNGCTDMERDRGAKAEAALKQHKGDDNAE